MNKSFPGFYQPTDKELEKAWKSEKTLFVFDTNTFLNLYGYATQTQDDFFSILGILSPKIWVPYHVILEYQKRRLSVVKNEKAIFSTIDNYLGKIEDIFKSDFPTIELNRRFPALHKNTEKLQSEVKKLISNYKKSVTHWDKKQSCVRGHDIIRERLTSIFEDKVGTIPVDQAWLDVIYKEGEIRYKTKTPPGFKDSKKGNRDDNIFIFAGLQYERKFGDLIIWKQIIEKAKDQNIESVILVTDDTKEDWWYILDSRGKKTIGPRAELREEITNQSSIKLFTMYNTSGFLENGKQILKLKISDDSISDAGDKFINTIDNRHKYLDMLKTAREEAAKLNYDFSKNALWPTDLEKNSFQKFKNAISRDDYAKIMMDYEKKYKPQIDRLMHDETFQNLKQLDLDHLKYIKKMHEQLQNNLWVSEFIKKNKKNNDSSDDE